MGVHRHMLKACGVRHIIKTCGLSSHDQAIWFSSHEQDIWVSSHAQDTRVFVTCSRRMGFRHVLKTYGLSSHAQDDMGVRHMLKKHVPLESSRVERVFGTCSRNIDIRLNSIQDSIRFDSIRFDFEANK